MKEKVFTATAKLNYLKIAPRKTRLVAHVVKGMDIVRAEAELLYRPQRAAKAILKLLRSAISNASVSGLDKEKLFIKDIRVDQGPMLKRFMPRAMGRATPIHKKSSHIILTLEEKPEVITQTYKVPIAKLTKSEERIDKTKEDHQDKEKVGRGRSRAAKEVGAKALKSSKAPKIFRRKEIAS